MEIYARNENGIWIVGLIGSFDTASANPAEQELMELLDGGDLKMLLDFSEVAYIASSGLRVLLKVAKRLQKEEGQLRLCGLNDTVIEVFRIAGFDKILAVFETRQQALETFA